MSAVRLILCRKLRQKLPALETPPFPGKVGAEIYATVSQRAWSQWLEMQTMIINEQQLQLFDPQVRAYLQQQMFKFLDNQSYDKPAGYVPPEKDE